MLLLYFIQLILSILGFIGLLFTNYWLIKNFNKTEDSNEYNEYPLIKRVGLIFGSFLLTIVFGYVSIISILDLPEVLSNNPEKYEGNCEIEITHGKGGGLDALFDDKIIEFPTHFYSNAEEGNYYCKVSYFKHSEEGKSLKLYMHKGGKEIDTK